MKGPGMKKRWTVGIVAAMAMLAGVLALTATVSARDTASASAANCNGRAFSPTQTGNKLHAKADLTCTGSVAKMRLTACLEQQVRSGFKTVKCDTEIRQRAGTITVRVERACGNSVERKFRTRAFLFLKDRNGRSADGKAISPTPVFPRRC